ncbi:MAG: hypothetical protein J6S58_02170 [Lentisphaeria bacterium]|nr:hypothetical protein [Lentisphaeria bacterium]
MNPEENTPGTKLELISIEIRRQQKQNHNSLRHTLLFVLILLVFFSMYSALIVYKIREVATPSTIALLIAGELRDEASSGKSKLISDNLKLLSRETAHGAVSVLPLLAGPVAEQKIQDFLSEKNLSAAEECAGRLFTEKEYRNILHELLLLPEKKVLSDKEKKHYADRILSAQDQQTPKAEHPLFFLTPGFIGKMLFQLRIKPRSSWTKQETAFYDFVRCCFYFGENKRYRDSAYSFFFDLGQPVIQELGFPENTETLLRTKQKEPR